MAKFRYMVHIVEKEGLIGGPDTYYFGDSVEAVKAEALRDYEPSDITGVYELELLEGKESLPG